MSSTEAPHQFGRLRRKVKEMDLNQVNQITKDNRTHYENPPSVKSNSRRGEEEDQIEIEKAEENSVHTSYHYHKKEQQKSQSNSSISNADDLICDECINCLLIEDKKKRKEIENDLEKKYLDAGNVENNLNDKNRKYDQNKIEERRRMREENTNQVINNLAKINANPNSKERLIRENENSTNPLFDKNHNYEYEKFQVNFEKKQKLINDNLDKYKFNERPEVTKYYKHYVYDDKNKGATENYGDDKDDNRLNFTDKNEYIKSLQEQINAKNDKIRREKEEDQRREKQQFLLLQEQIKNEQKEKLEKEQRQREELIRGNMEIMMQKNKKKEQQLNEKMRYNQLYEEENKKIKNDLINEREKKEKMKNDFVKANDDNLEKRRIKRAKEIQEDENLEDYDNIYVQPLPKKERMGRCCKCHKVFPRRLLSINRYFYRDNRSKK